MPHTFGTGLRNCSQADLWSLIQAAQRVSLIHATPQRFPAIGPRSLAEEQKAPEVVHKKSPQRAPKDKQENNKINIEAGFCDLGYQR